MKPDAAAAAVLGLAVAGLYVAPEHIAAAGGWYQPGVEYVAGGIERCSLWLFAAFMAWVHGQHRLAVVALWPAYEGGLMAASRLALPMTGPVKLPPGETMAAAVWGPSATWISIALAFSATAYAASGLSGHGRSNGR